MKIDAARRDLNASVNILICKNRIKYFSDCNEGSKLSVRVSRAYEICFIFSQILYFFFPS